MIIYLNMGVRLKGVRDTSGKKLITKKVLGVKS